MKHVRIRLFAIAAVLLAAASPAAADIWIEVGDAGQLPSTAQVPLPQSPSTGTLDTIFGTFGTPTDVDMYKIMIDNPASFSATTLNQSNVLLDTKLYLFNAGGMGVYANDDANASTLLSTLPAGDPNGPTSPGVYYLAISAFGISPTSAGGAIFPDFPFESVFGPTGPGGSSPVTDWVGSGDTGAYRIDLTGAKFAAVPEPSGLTLLTLGGLAAFRFRRRVPQSKT